MSKNCALCGRFANSDHHVTFTGDEIDELKALVMRGDEQRLMDVVQRRLLPHRPVRSPLRLRRGIRAPDGRPVIA